MNKNCFLTDSGIALMVQAWFVTVIPLIGVFH